jgi:hypothetical protein
VGVEDTVKECFFAKDNFKTQEPIPVYMFLNDVFTDVKTSSFHLRCQNNSQMTGQAMWYQVPSQWCVVCTIQNQPSAHLLKGLFDSRGMQTFINLHCLPAGDMSSALKTPMQGLTAAGPFTANHRVELKDILLPELSRSKQIDGHWAFDFDVPLEYIIVFGQDFLLKIGLDICF